MSAGAIEIKEDARLRADATPGRQGEADGQSPHPFIPAQLQLRELTPVPLLMGIVLGLIFGASSLYLVLKVGLTISASIPLAVISITLFRLLSKFGLRDATILENNIVQTAGSVGEAVAFGIGVTMPAIMILGFDLKLINVLLVAVIGGLLGILLTIPLRHGLIVLERKRLRYPEGVACAEILEAGATTIPHNSWNDEEADRDLRESAREFPARINPKTIFMGFGISFLYQTLMSVLKLWKEFPTKVFSRPFESGSVSLENNPALLGVGYIIGPRIAAIMAAGGAFSYLVFVPLIKYLGSGATTPLAPGTTLISEMGPDEIRNTYILYIGAGAVVTGGLVNLFRTLPIIIRSMKSALSHGIWRTDGTAVPRTERDLSSKLIIIGIIVLTAMSMIFSSLHINFLGMLLMLLFSFMFVRISARITGQIGSSATPISGITVATLLLVCVVFILVGWTSPLYYVAALSIGAIVCVAASTASTTSQVLKTGYLVGAAPRNQQIAILLGTLFSALVLGNVLIKLNEWGTVYVPRVTFEKVDGKKQLPMGLIPELKPYEDKAKPPEPGLYRGFSAGSDDVRDGLSGGDYLVDELSGRIAYRIRHNFPVAQADVSKLTETEKLKGPQSAIDANIYKVWQREGSSTEASGKYLCDEQGYAAYLVDPGINGVYRKSSGDVRSSEGSTVEKYAAPKAQLMAYIIKGILNRQFPWRLVLLGVMLAIVMEMCGVSSLPFAAGLYLPLASSTPILIGGLVRWLVDREGRSRMEGQAEDVSDAESGPGIMAASGLIAGTAIAGIFIAFTAGFFSKINASLEDWATRNNPFFEGPYADLLSFILFMLLALFLYLMGGAMGPPDRDGKRSESVTTSITNR